MLPPGNPSVRFQRSAPASTADRLAAVVQRPDNTVGILARRCGDPWLMECSIERAGVVSGERIHARGTEETTLAVFDSRHLPTDPDRRSGVRMVGRAQAAGCRIGGRKLDH